LSGMVGSMMPASIAGFRYRSSKLARPFNNRLSCNCYRDCSPRIISITLQISTATCPVTCLGTSPVSSLLLRLIEMTKPSEIENSGSSSLADRQRRIMSRVPIPIRP
jgi:hypothetical protein